MLEPIQSRLIEAVDVIASKQTLQSIKDAQSRRKDSLPVVGYVPSRVVQKTVLARDLETALKPTGAQVIPGIIQRVAIAESVLHRAPTVHGEAPPVSKGSTKFYDFDDYARLVEAARRLDARTHLIALLGGRRDYGAARRSRWNGATWIS